MLVLLRSGFMYCGRAFTTGFHHLTLGDCAPRDHRVDSARPPRSRILGRPPSPPTGVVPYAPVASMPTASSFSVKPKNSDSPVTSRTRRSERVGLTTVKRVPTAV